MLSGTFFGSANILKSYDRIKIIMLFLRFTVVERFTCQQVNIVRRGGCQLSIRLVVTLQHLDWTGDWTRDWSVSEPQGIFVTRLLPGSAVRILQ